jgi:glycosyltransferase involved in cell wall biosynthesis
VRISYLSPTTLIRRPLSELARLLAEEGHEITIITPTRGKEGHERSLHHTALLRHENITVKTFPTWQPPGLEWEWPVPKGKACARLVEEALRGSDAVHTWTFHYPTSLLLARIARRLRKRGEKEARVVITLDTLPGYSFRSGAVMDRLFRIHTKTVGKSILKEADVLTVYGKSLAALMKKEGLPPVTVIPTGVLPQKEEHRKNISLKDILKERKLPTNHKTVVFVGLVGKRKGIDLLLKTAERIPEANFLVVGDGPKRGSYERQAPKNVAFLGFRKDAPALIEASDVFFLPSRGEGLPGVVFEALSAGTPVVASDIPCIPDQFTSGKEGFLVEEGDVEGYTKAIKRLLKDATLRRKMGAAGKKRGKGHSWTTLVPRYLSLYKQRGRR